ncbi:hypothetical protein TCAL_12558 [Tigriopus californicus]|uniref:Homeobox domain-containing protein n=1 Tax=Tigriopus californicus TaxID=6832 RepID=A0A553PHP9_TIGCA|nr:homeobox protein Nkx-6.1-like [Tigriopus californicus]TRY77211.1 hypothetical protein TCAL_12558 [Tigriopus californicus]
MTQRSANSPSVAIVQEATPTIPNSQVSRRSEDQHNKDNNMRALTEHLSSSSSALVHASQLSDSSNTPSLGVRDSNGIVMWHPHVYQEPPKQPTPFSIDDILQKRKNYLASRRQGELPVMNASESGRIFGGEQPSSRISTPSAIEDDLDQPLNLTTKRENEPDILRDSMGHALSSAHKRKRESIGSSGQSPSASMLHRLESSGSHSVSDSEEEERKKKKVRTTFTGRQIFELEKMFEAKKYLSSSERSEMAKNLNVTEQQVKIWFQNRRTKWKKQENISNAEANELLKSKNAALKAKNATLSSSKSQSSPTTSACNTQDGCGVASMLGKLNPSSPGSTSSQPRRPVSTSPSTSAPSLMDTFHSAGVPFDLQAAQSQLLNLAAQRGNLQAAAAASLLLSTTSFPGKPSESSSHRPFMGNHQSDLSFKYLSSTDQTSDDDMKSPLGNEYSQPATEPDPEEAKLVIDDHDKSELKESESNLETGDPTSSSSPDLKDVKLRMEAQVQLQSLRGDREPELKPDRIDNINVISENPADNSNEHVILRSKLESE